MVPHEGSVVDLDHNRINFGRLGPPPLLPDKRCRKLLQLILSSAPAFERRGADWSESRLPLFDSAFTVVTDSAAMESDKAQDTFQGLSKNMKDGEVNESAVRAGFLNFFVSILKNYRRYIRHAEVTPVQQKNTPFPYSSKIVKITCEASVRQHTTLKCNAILYFPSSFVLQPSVIPFPTTPPLVLS